MPSAPPTVPRPAAAPAAVAPVSAKRRRRRRAAVRALVGTVAFVGVVAGAVAGVVAVLGREEAVPVVIRCAASLDGADWYLEPDQAETVALLAGQAQQRALPARALTVAIATGLQESKLRNLASGDRDSVGIFQQRPSQGWGTVEQIMDPVFATGAFYDALAGVPGYEDMAITEAAQAVQRSAFPDAYAQHEGTSRAWASAMYGYSGGAVTCTLDEADGVGDAQAVIDRAARDLGITATATEAGVVLDAAALVAAPEHAERVGWAVAHWAVTVAAPLQITAVEHAGSAWDRDVGTWSPVAPEGTAALAPGQVLVTLAG